MEEKILTINEIQTIVTEKGNCMCGVSLTGVRMQMYDHPGGINIVEAVEKQWVYFVCNKCGYQNALWKIFRRIEELHLMRL